VELDWNLLQKRYAPGTELPALTGGARIYVTGIDDEKLSVRSHLWRDSISRKDLETAVTLLRTGELPRQPVGFAEALRRRQLEGEDVNPACSRVPNMTAVVLKDLGYLEG
jgi:hypothetical protein